LFHLNNIAKLNLPEIDESTKNGFNNTIKEYISKYNQSQNPCLISEEKIFDQLDACTILKQIKHDGEDQKAWAKESGIFTGSDLRLIGFDKTIVFLGNRLLEGGFVQSFVDQIKDLLNKKKQLLQSRFNSKDYNWTTILESSGFANSIELLLRHIISNNNSNYEWSREVIDLDTRICNFLFDRFVECSQDVAAILKKEKVISLSALANKRKTPVGQNPIVEKIKPNPYGSRHKTTETKKRALE